MSRTLQTSCARVHSSSAWSAPPGTLHDESWDSGAQCLATIEKHCVSVRARLQTARDIRLIIFSLACREHALNGAYVTAKGMGARTDPPMARGHGPRVRIRKFTKIVNRCETEAMQIYRPCPPGAVICEIASARAQSSRRVVVSCHQRGIALELRCCVSRHQRNLVVPPFLKQHCL